MRLVLVMLAGGLLAASAIAEQQSSVLARYQRPHRQLATLKNGDINESSGLAVGRANPALLWTHNDSGDKARVFAFDLQGRHIAEIRLKDVKAKDFEDMASFTLDEKHYLLLGDIGDNDRSRKHRTLYVIEEPVIDLGDVPVEREAEVVRKIRYTYEGGPQDCEAVAVDTATRQIILIDKQWSSTGDLSKEETCSVYTLPLDPAAAENDEKLEAKKVASLYVPIVTGADITVDGGRVIVGTYFNAFEFYRGEDESWPDAFSGKPQILFMPIRKQGEAICYSGDGKKLYLTSEKRPTPLWEVDLEAGNGPLD